MPADGERDHECLIVPGLDNSGPGHWQTLWEETRGDCRRAELVCWSNPDRDLWVARLDAAIGRDGPPLILIGHSLGCLAIAWWARQFGHRAAKRGIAGALLVAPPDVDRPDAHPLVQRFAPAPDGRLPFPSILVASHNDGYACFDCLEQLSARWGSRLVDAGSCGHVNAASGLGRWPQGEALLDNLITRTIDALPAGRADASGSSIAHRGIL